MKLSDHAPEGAQTGTGVQPRGSLQRMVRPLDISQKGKYLFPVICVIWLCLTNSVAQSNELISERRQKGAACFSAIAHDMGSEVCVDFANFGVWLVNHSNPLSYMSCKMDAGNNMLSTNGEKMTSDGSDKPSSENPNDRLNSFWIHFIISFVTGFGLIFAFHIWWWHWPIEWPNDRTEPRRTSDKQPETAGEPGVGSSDLLDNK